MASAQDEFNELMRDKERRTQHPDDEDSDDARSFLNLSDDDDDDATPVGSTADPDDYDPRASMSSARHTIPLTRYEANTGPKGVISDAQNFRDSRRSHRVSLRSNSNLPSQGPGGVSPPSQTPIEEKISESEEDLDDGEDDTAFMKKWRKSRLRELQNGAFDSKLHSREKSKRLWGGLTTVDGNGYLDALEKSARDGVVVVFIYDDYVSILRYLCFAHATDTDLEQSHVSSAVEDCLRTLAQKHLDVRFIKLHYQDAEMEPAGVPALLAYRGGDKFAGLVPLIDEIPDDADLSSLTLEHVMKRYVHSYTPYLVHLGD